MTTVTAEKIPNDSYALRVFSGDDTPNGSDIETVLILKNLGDKVCEVALAHGHLYDEANILIGLKAYELGFLILRFHTLPGKIVTRWAHRVEDENKNFAYYEVNLVEAIAKFMIQSAL